MCVALLLLTLGAGYLYSCQSNLFCTQISCSCAVVHILTTDKYMAAINKVPSAYLFGRSAHLLSAAGVRCLIAVYFGCRVLVVVAVQSTIPVFTLGVVIPSVIGHCGLPENRSRHFLSNPSSPDMGSGSRGRCCCPSNQKYLQ